MRCWNCDTELPDDAVYCTNCGKRVDQTPDTHLQSEEAPAGQESPVESEYVEQSIEDESSGGSEYVEQSIGQESPDETEYVEQSIGQESPDETEYVEQSIGQESPVESEYVEQPSAVSGPGPQAPLPAKKRSLLYPAIGVAAVVIALVVYFASTSSGSLSYDNIVTKTRKAYQSEVTELFKVNPVLKALSDNINASYELQYRFPEGRVNVKNDAKAKVLQVELRSDDMPVQGALYVTDTKLIAGVPGVAMVEANPKRLGSDLLDLSDGMGSSLRNMTGINLRSYESVFTMLDTYDLSYSGLMSGKTWIGSVDMTTVETLILDQMSKLVKRADYTKGKGEVEIEGKSVKTDMVTITINAKAMKDWCTKDLLPTLRKSQELRKYMEAMIAYQSTVSYYYYGPKDYDFMLDDLEYEIESFIEDMEDERGQIVVSVHTIKGIAVSVEVFVKSDSYREDMGFVISALGATRRLDDIRITTYDGYSRGPDTRVSITGDHFSKTEFTSTISVRNSWSNNRVTINWDLTESSNNLRIRGDGDNLRLTFAAEGSTVTFRYTDYWDDDYRFTLQPLTGSVEVPEKTTKIKDFDIRDVMDGLGMGWYY